MKNSECMLTRLISFPHGLSATWEEYSHVTGETLLTRGVIDDICKKRFEIAMQQRKLLQTEQQGCRFLTWPATVSGPHFYGVALEKPNAYGTLRFRFISWMPQNEVKALGLRIPQPLTFFNSAPHYDSNKPLNVSPYHCLSRKTRLPKEFHTMDDKVLLSLIQNSLLNLRRYLNNNPKAEIIPLYSDYGVQQFLAPLCLYGYENEATVQAAVIIREGNSLDYQYVATMITLGKAFKDASLHRDSKALQKSWLNNRHIS